jgi:putative FmdB family regulatory protein
MPIFEFVCKDCGRDFEALVRSGAQPECPRCRSLQLEKRLSVFAAATSAEPAGIAPCGSCGDPAGPGACRLR